MSETSRRLSARDLWLLVFGAGSLWLLVQNTILALGLLWARPSEAATVTAALAKVTVRLIEGFWRSPAAGWTVALALALALLVSVAAPWRGRRVVRNG